MGASRKPRRAPTGVASLTSCSLPSGAICSCMAARALCSMSRVTRCIEHAARNSFAQCIGGHRRKCRFEIGRGVVDHRVPQPARMLCKSERIGERDSALLQLSPRRMRARQQDERVDQPHQRPAIAARPQLTVSAAVTLEAVEQQTVVGLQRPRVTEQLADGLIEVAIVASRMRERGEERPVDVHAIDPDLPAPTGRVAAVIALAIRAGRKACVERGEFARGFEKLRRRRYVDAFEQLAPGADVIFVGARDAASQPGAQDSVNETEWRSIAEHITGSQQSAQRDRLAETPYAIVPAHGDCRRPLSAARVSCALQQNFEQSARAGMIAAAPAGSTAFARS